MEILVIPFREDDKATTVLDDFAVPEAPEQRFCKAMDWSEPEVIDIPVDIISCEYAIEDKSLISLKPCFEDGRCSGKEALVV